MGLIVGAEGLAGVISPLWSEFALSNSYPIATFI